MKLALAGYRGRLTPGPGGGTFKGSDKHAERALRPGRTNKKHMAMTFSPSNFEAEVLKGSGVVLVDFWAPWCAPCRMLAPVIEELAHDFEGRAKVGKMNVDEAGAIAQQFNIMSIPTLIIFKDGQPVDMVVGLQSKAALAEKISKHLG